MGASVLPVRQPLTAVAFALSPGPQGLQGPTGPQGLTGPSGPQGPIGQVGPMGPPGVQGPVGPIGVTGPRGQTGDTGPQGPLGPQGPVGPQGPPGQSSIVYQARQTAGVRLFGWAAIPGLSISLTVPTTTIVDVIVYGHAATLVSLGQAGAYCGLRFMLDGISQGEAASQGANAIVGTSGSPCCGGYPIGGLYSVAMPIRLSLTPGMHTITVEGAALGGDGAVAFGPVPSLPSVALAYIYATLR